MSNYEELKWQELEKEIILAFKDLKLENGIGYFEAGAINNYLSPIDLKYIDEKSKDERYNWIKLISIFENQKLDNSRHCFMDAKGLRFYLPLLMIRKDTIINSIFYFYFIYQNNHFFKEKYNEMISLLNKAQKQSIFRFYDFLNSVKHPGFSEKDLQFIFDLGAVKINNFNFMKFMKKIFDLE